RSESARGLEREDDARRALEVGSAVGRRGGRVVVTASAHGRARRLRIAAGAAAARAALPGTAAAASGPGLLREERVHRGGREARAAEEVDESQEQDDETAPRH